MSLSQSQLETVRKLRADLERLNDIARQEQFPMLAYLIEMAVVEAQDMEAREPQSRRH